MKIVERKEENVSAGDGFSGELYAIVWKYVQNNFKTMCNVDVEKFKLFPQQQGLKRHCEVLM